MKGHEQVIHLLNDVLTAELTAINQYWIHARMCENWGYERLWKKIREESLGDLEGIPNLQRLGKVNVGQTVKEQLQLDLEVEKAAVNALNAGIETARSLGDNGTRELFESILQGEEEHANWIEAQLTLIEQVGEGNYLAQQITSDA